ncbi:hypothetical protein [Ferruginibacter sp. SUN106]|uniref:hypothetical protein n=1 Tax=Ferruginibacter sp. SUN106 TaxID=2978348 RepID=UPI003D36F9E3
MRTIVTISLLFLLTTLLCSCPYSSQYKLDENPNIYVEDDLLGSWATFVKKPVSGKEEPVKLILSKKNETEYNIAFTGKIDELRPFKLVAKDSISGTAFMSTAAGRQFLNITIKGTNYIAELKLKDGALSLLPLVEHFTGKMIQNNTDLRNCVEFHYRTRVHAMYDDEFCLRDMVKVN